MVKNNKFDYHNVNPLGKREEDCVNRAISLALNEDYYKIKHKLKLIAELFECKELCVCCYKHLLDDVYNLSSINHCKGITINEFLNRYNKGTYIIRTDGHLTCGINGRLKDTWDCGNSIIDRVWVVK